MTVRSRSLVLCLALLVCTPAFAQQRVQVFPQVALGDGVDLDPQDPRRIIVVHGHGAEAVRAHGAVAIRLVKTAEEATATRQHTPKLAFVAKPAAYKASDGKTVEVSSVDLLARIFSMGVLHHAMTGTGAVAIAAAAAIPGTLVHRVAPAGADGRVRFGHPSGTLSVGAEAREENGQWAIKKVMMSRSARRLMEGWVRVPDV